MTTPLYLKNNVVSQAMFLTENGVMIGMLVFALICLAVFVVKYGKEIEEDDVIFLSGFDVVNLEEKTIFVFECLL